MEVGYLHYCKLSGGYIRLKAGLIHTIVLVILAKVEQHDVGCVEPPKRIEGDF